MEWFLALSLIVNGVQFYFNGNLKSEKDHYQAQFESIAKQCSTDRDRERSTEIAIASERARADREAAQILEDGQRYVQRSIKDADMACLDSRFPLGRELYHLIGDYFHPDNQP